MADSLVDVRGVSKVFNRRDGSDVVAAHDVSFTVEPGEIIVLLGPSGCGKTTLLRMIAGLEQPDDGEIFVNGHCVFSKSRKVSVPPELRRIGMMFQTYALWPHMTAARNVSYPLECRRVPRAKRRQLVADALARVGIPTLGEQYPSQMSGGQQQRVALARAIVDGSRLVLFDEPLSNVDAKVRAHLRLELKDMQRTIGFAAVYVTHDQSEALALGDRIAVVRDGQIEQLAPPQDLYRRPINRDVADFVGTMNQISGTVTEVKGADTVDVKTPLGLVRGRPSGISPSIGDEVTVLVRPERMVLATHPSARPNEFHASVDKVVFMGPHNEYQVDAEGEHLSVWTHEDRLEPPGSEVWVQLPEESVLIVSGSG